VCDFEHSSVQKAETIREGRRSLVENIKLCMMDYFLYARRQLHFAFSFFISLRRCINHKAGVNHLEFGNKHFDTRFTRECDVDIFS